MLSIDLVHLKQKTIFEAKRQEARKKIFKFKLLKDLSWSKIKLENFQHPTTILDNILHFDNASCTQAQFFRYDTHGTIYNVNKSTAVNIVSRKTNFTTKAFTNFLYFSSSLHIHYFIHSHKDVFPNIYVVSLLHHSIWPNNPGSRFFFITVFKTFILRFHSPYYLKPNFHLQM